MIEREWMRWRAERKAREEQANLVIACVFIAIVVVALLAFIYPAKS